MPFHIIIQSGYRTPGHNARLAKAAKKSQHVLGNAADIRIPGLDTTALTRLAKAIGVGGVGFYPHNGFVHVDVGRVREWTADPINQLSVLFPCLWAGATKLFAKSSAR